MNGTWQYEINGGFGLMLRRQDPACNQFLENIRKHLTEVHSRFPELQPKSGDLDTLYNAYVYMGWSWHLYNSPHQHVFYFDKHAKHKMLLSINKERYDFPDGDETLLVKAKKQPSPFECAYHNTQELIDEFDRILRHCLPKDFRLEENIGWFWCITRY